MACFMELLMFLVGQEFEAVNHGDYDVAAGKRMGVRTWHWMTVSAAS
jgi:hypothetical protein